MTSDFVILGAGCSGLSLAVHLARAGLGERRITIVDRRTRFERDRTWCFWNALPHPFEPAVSHQWPEWEVRTAGRSVTRRSPGLVYQHLPGDRYYQQALAELRDHPGVDLRLGVDARDVEEAEDRVVVTTDGEPLEARMVFDSRPPRDESSSDSGGRSSSGPEPATSEDVHLLQHFRGYFVRSARPAFDPELATLMDFGVDQKRGIHFIYVLPFAPDHALVETTYFSPSTLGEDVYEADLRDYLDQRLGSGTWEVTDSERGVIPMSTRPYEARPGRRWCRIGVAAGLARPSTGYAFLAIQRFTGRLASRLAATRNPEEVTLPEVRPARTLFLDRVYLSYLGRFPERAPEIMLRLFEATPADVLVRFLSETGSVADDLRVMRGMPSSLAVEAYRSRRLWLPR